MEEHQLKEKKIMFLRNNLYGKHYGESTATFVNSTYQSEYVAFKAEIEQQIANMEKRPSFDGTTITVQAGETTTITDTNGVLSKYNSVNVTTNGITITHTKGNDYMTITVSEDCEIETYKISDAMMEEWGLIKEGTEDNDTTIYFEFENGVQNQLYAMNYNDPVTLSMTLNIELYGKLELSKLNTNGDLIDGAIFNITNSSGYNENVEVTNGKITIENLKKGTYYIKEVSSPTGYLLNTETYKVTIEANQTTQKAIVNNEPTGEITITKTDAETGNQDRIDGTSHHGDASLNGAVYTLYAKTDIYNKSETVKYFSKDEEIAKFIFNEYGVASIEITNTIQIIRIFENLFILFLFIYSSK